MADFIGLAALKLALDVTDTSADAQLAMLNGAATSLMIDWMNRDPRADDFKERANGLGSGKLLVNQYPIIAVASIAITRAGFRSDTRAGFGSDKPAAFGQTLQPELLVPSQWDFDDNLIWRTDGGGFPRGSRNVTVAYTAGLDPVPKSLALAATYTVRALLTARKVDLNSSGESWAGVSSQTWSAGGPGTVPVAAQTILGNYARRWSV